MARRAQMGVYPIGIVNSHKSKRLPIVVESNSKMKEMQGGVQ